MQTMTDTFQQTAASIQRTNLVKATITDTSYNWTEYTGTVANTTLVGTASAKNEAFNAGGLSGSGTGTQVVSVMLRQALSGTGLTLYVRSETDFNGFSNISSWTSIWNSTTAEVATPGNSSGGGGEVAVAYDEKRNAWVVAWYSHETILTSNNTNGGGVSYDNICSMQSTNGTTWNNWDSHSYPSIIQTPGYYGSTTCMNASLAFAAKDMTQLGYAGQDLVLLIFADSATMSGAGGGADGQQVFVLHRLNTYWDNTTYQWNQGPLYIGTAIAATYVSGLNQIYIVIEGSDQTGEFSYIYTTFWNGDTSPMNFTPPNIFQTVDVAGGGQVGSAVPYSRITLHRYIYSGEPDTQFIMTYYQASLINGVTNLDIYMSKALIWDQWSDPILFDPGTDTAATSIFYDSVNSQYIAFGTNFCRKSPVGLTADISADIISYSRTLATSGNAGTLSMIVNNRDAYNGSKWWSSGGSSAITNTNLVTNPSFVTNTTSWNAWIGTIARDATTGYNGTTSLKITPAGVGSAADVTYTYTIGVPYTLQMRVKGNAGITFTLHATSNASSGTFYCTGNWDLVTWTFTPTVASSSYEIDMSTADTNPVWIDQVMLEQNSTASQYFDGSFGGGKYAWTGTANGSTSTYAGNSSPLTGTNASAIKRNAKIVVQEGFVTSLGNEYTTVGSFFIDDLKADITGTDYNFDIEARDNMKKTIDYSPLTNVNWQSQQQFADFFTESQLNTSNWTTQSIPGIQQGQAQWAVASNLLTITPDADALMTYNAQIRNGVIQIGVSNTAWTGSQNCGIAFNVQTNNGIMTWLEMDISQSAIWLSEYNSSTGETITTPFNVISNLANNTFYYFRIIFQNDSYWAYYSTDAINWITLWGSPISIPSPASINSYGLVGLKVTAPTGVGTLSFNQFIVYDLHADQNIEDICSDINALAQNYRTNFDSNYYTGFQNQLLNPSFESPNSGNTGVIFPTTVSDDTAVGTIAWSNLTNIGAADSAYVQATPTLNSITNRIDVQGFGLTVPTNATITGVQVGIKRLTLLTQPNYCTNGTFETNTTGWAGTGASIAQSTVQAHSGTHSLIITDADGNFDGAYFTGANAIGIGVTYTLTLWIYTNILNQNWTIGLYNNNGLAAIGIATAIGGAVAGWQQVTVSGVTTTIAPMYIYVRNSGNTTPYYIDDVTLTVSTVTDNEVRLIKGNVVQLGQNRANTTAIWPGSNTLVTYGGQYDMWGLALAPADVNSPTFGAALSAAIVDNTNGTNTNGVEVDDMNIEVFYTVPTAQTTNWTNVDANSCVSTLTTDSTTSGPYGGLVSGLVTITAAPTSTPTDVKITQGSIALVGATLATFTTYVLSFSAKASTPRVIQAKVAGTNTELAATNFQLETQWQNYSISFNVTTSDTSTLSFNLNNGSLGTIWIDCVQLESLAPFSTSTKPTQFDASNDKIGPIFGSGSTSGAITGGNLNGGALSIQGDATDFAYAPLVTPIQPDFKLTFNTRLRQTGITNGTGGRVVYRNNAPGALQNGYVFDYGLPKNASNWYSTSWAYRQRINIPSGQITGLIPDFVFTFDLSALGSEFWNNAMSTGADVIVTDSSGTNKLFRELKNFNNSTQTGQIYFNCGTTSMNTGAQNFYIYFGNASGTETNSTSTWSTTYYSSIFHLDDSPTGGAYLDSSANAENLTPFGTSTSANQVTGKLGNAFFPNNTAVLANGGNFAPPESPVVYFCWANFTSASMGGSIIAVTNAAESVGNGLGVGSGTFGTNGNHLVFISEAWNWEDTGVNIGTGWHQIGLHVVNTTTYRAFIDGTFVGSFTTGGTNGGATYYSIGGWTNRTGTFNRQFDGYIDEVIISGNMTEDYIMTSYNNIAKMKSGFWQINTAEYYYYSDWELKRIDNGIIKSIGGKNTNTFGLTVSTSSQPNLWNTVSISANGPWHTVTVNEQVIITVYDATYLSTSTGTGYLMLGGGNATQATYFDDIRIPQLWQPIPQLTMSPTDTGQQVIDNLAQTAGALYWTTYNNYFRMRKLLAADPLVWSFTANTIIEDNYDVSDKEFYTTVIAYGAGTLSATNQDTTKMISLGENRNYVVSDEQMTNTSTTTARAALELQLSQQYLSQPDLTIFAQPAMEIYDVISVADSKIGLVAANYRLTGATVIFDAQTDGLDENLSVGQLTGL